jgi:hypothetical protein
MSNKHTYRDNFSNRVCDVSGELLHSFGRFSKYFTRCNNNVEPEKAPKCPIVENKASSLASMEIREKHINKQVYLPTSLYINHKKKINCPLSENMCNRWNQSSDQKAPASSNRIVPRVTNTRQRTRTSNLPGATSSRDVGVDIKHNSYDRVLLRKKAETRL